MDQLILSPAKCAFVVKRGILLAHIISKEGMQVDPRNIAAIQKAKAPKNSKDLGKIETP